MTGRGQANLASVAVAVVLLTSVTALSLLVADDALRSGDRRSLERHAASAVAEGLVADGSPLTGRPGHLRSNATRNLTIERVDRLAPPAAGRDVRVRLGSRWLVDESGAGGGSTVHRVVRVVTATPTRRAVRPNASRPVTVPSGTSTVELDVRTAPNTTLRTVRADTRVVLRDPNGIEGTTRVSLSPYDPTTLRFETSAGNDSGRVTLTYDRIRSRPAVLEVTVDG